MRTWVLLRGWAREARHWGPFPELLGAAFPDARIVALDLPGNGRFHGRPSPCSVAAMAAHSHNALREIGVAPPYSLLGLSLGGMVALEWMASHPAQIAAGVLLNTSARPFCSLAARLHPRNYMRLLRLLLERDAVRREAGILQLTSAAPGTHPDLPATWAGYARERPVSRASVLRQLYAAATCRAPVRPTVPLFVLASRGDRLVDCACSLALARRWNAALALHPSAGHDLTLDAGEWVASEIAAWIRRT